MKVEKTQNVISPMMMYICQKALSFYVLVLYSKNKFLKQNCYKIK